MTLRDHHRKKLNKLLAAADDEQFVQLLWAVQALQSGHSNAAFKYIRQETVPTAAITKDYGSEFMIHKWQIETLINELMTVPKNRRKRGRKTWILKHDDFMVARACSLFLRRLENIEYPIQKRSEDVFVEMGRIAARQFEWQQGYFNVPQFYRNAFIYGQGECAAHFERRYGITVNRFSLMGLMLFANFTRSPVFRYESFPKEMNVTSDEFDQVMSMISLPFEKASKEARVKRKNFIHTADRPSILRQLPCLRFGKDGERIRAPLPDLILERVTSGVFYDIVGGGGEVRNEYGRNLEEYCFRYLSETLPGFAPEREFRYGRNKSNRSNTPDILCYEDDRIVFAFECKATRMSHEAMFGKNPIQDRGYQDLIQGVFQLWRFFSHCRHGYVRPDFHAANEAVGLVLTLDNWLVMSEFLREQVLKDATARAKEKDPEIIEADRRPVLFVSVTELERILAVATEETFKSAIRRTREKSFGWRLDSVLEEMFEGQKKSKRKYPFMSDIGRLLPWWDDLDREHA